MCLRIRGKFLSVVGATGILRVVVVGHGVSTILVPSPPKKSVKNAYKVEKWSEYELGSWAAFGRMKTKHRCCRTTAEPFIGIIRCETWLPTLDVLSPLLRRATVESSSSPVADGRLFTRGFPTAEPARS